MLDEAGFDVLIGSAESQVPSALYSEKVYVMAKGFIKTALTNAPHGIADIVNWLYLSRQPGPQLLRRVLDDAKKLLTNTTYTSSTNNNTISTASSAISNTTMDERGFARAKLSTGASILLQRHVDWLEDFMRRNDGHSAALND